MTAEKLFLGKIFVLFFQHPNSNTSKRINYAASLTHSCFLNLIFFQSNEFHVPFLFNVTFALYVQNSSFCPQTHQTDLFGHLYCVCVCLSKIRATNFVV